MNKQAARLPPDEGSAGVCWFSSLGLRQHPLCANAPLFVVNNLKLAGLLAVATLGAWLALAGEK